MSITLAPISGLELTFRAPIRFSQYGKFTALDLEIAMLEGKTAEELRQIAFAGGGLEINGGAYTSDSLRAILFSAAGSACPCVIIHNSKTKTTDELRAIAFAGKGKAIFA